MKGYLLTIVIFIITWFPAKSQNLDTLKIYEGSCFIPYDTIVDYLKSDKELLLKDYNILDVQNIIPLFFDRENYYLKLYSSDSVLMIQGMKNKSFHFENEILFYYPNKKLQRIEVWGNSLVMQVGNNLMFTGSDNSYKPEGTWYFFNEEGILNKSIEYRLGIFPMDGDTCYYEIIKTYSKDTVNNSVLNKLECN